MGDAIRRDGMKAFREQKRLKRVVTSRVAIDNGKQVEGYLSYYVRVLLKNVLDEWLDQLT